MAISLALLQFKNISLGYISVDKLIKSTPVEVLKISNICPGALFVALSGNESDVADCEILAKDFDCLFQKIDNLNEDIKSLIKSNKRKKPSYNNVAIIETKKCVDAFVAADTCLKYSSVEVFRFDYQIGLFGKGVVFISGGIDDINAAIEKVETSLNKDKIANIALIPAVDKSIFS